MEEPRTAVACPREIAIAHLVIRLRPLVRALRVAAALRNAGSRQLLDAGAVAGAISAGHADLLLDRLSDLPEHRSFSAGHIGLSPDELAAEQQLRDKAAAQGARLPLDAIAAELALDEFEIEVLVLCAAVEVDIDFERVLAYVHDDVARKMVSIELACALTADSLRERLVRRAQLGPFGRLRRLGLVGVVARESGLRDELKLVPACVEALLGTPIDLALAFRDHADTRLELPANVPADESLASSAAAALAAGRVDVIAVWGTPRHTRDVIAWIANHAAVTIRRHQHTQDSAMAAVAASALSAALWIDLDAIGDQPPEDLLETCRRASVPVLLTGAQPWRPTELLASRRFVEVPVVAPDHVEREDLWRSEIPELDPATLERFATSYRFDSTEIKAAARVARASAALYSNGHVVTPADRLGAACLSVARKHGERHTTLVVPRRSAEDLVLAPELHERVLDLVHYFRAMPRVMTEWGFARRVSGGGIKALFTGEPGTGKTLAAEVVAHDLGLPMLKVDLARVVSKWIGETEKNLDLVFNEARDSHAVLFFDEAEALFGARGDVRHGTDRYANLEVSYLLQRLEDHEGVVILATNLRDKIDQAFIRRFHAVIGFPRPTEKERKRMWQRVFMPATPLAGDLDVAALARVDLTGAGVVGAAQTAALLAANEGRPVSMAHIVRGLVRQYQRESRVFSPTVLGAHAVHAGVDGR
jgi:hypothetical protein